MQRSMLEQFAAARGSDDQAPGGCRPLGNPRTWRHVEVEFAGKIMGKPWENHGKIMGKWENHGKIMGKSWEKHGTFHHK